jgi:hypothetical protein
MPVDPQYQLFVPQHLIVRLPSLPGRRPVRLPTEPERKLIQELKWKSIWFVILGESPPLFDRLRLIGRLMHQLEQRFGFVLTLNGWMVKLDPEILEYPLSAIEYAAAQQDIATVRRISTRP